MAALPSVTIPDTPKPPAFDVVIAGEINLALILYGLPADMPLEREILASNFVTTLGGSSSILAHNLSTLGTSVGFASVVGRDELGAIAVSRLRTSGVDLSQVRYDELLTTGVTVLLTHGEKRHILTYPGTMSEMTVDDLSFAYVSSARHFHVSSLFLQKALQPGLPRLFRQLKQLGRTISMDTNDDPDDRWGGVLNELLELIDILLPNEDELLRITCQPTVDAALHALSDRVPLVAVKRGARGATVQQGRFREDIPGVAVHPLDTIGVGDSFDAGFLHAWLQGAPASDAARLGNAMGALSTQRPGGTEAFRDLTFLRQFLQEHGGPESLRYLPSELRPA